MPKTGENIYKRKDGRWEGRYLKGRKPSGKALYGYVYAYSYKDVKKKLSAAVAGNHAPAKSRASGIAFSEMAEQWLRSQQARVKASTYNKYHNILYSYVLPYIGTVYLKELNAACVTDLCDVLLSCGGRQGNGLSEKTVADTLSVIRCVVQYAATMGHSCAFDAKSVRVRQQVRQLRIISPRDQQTLYSYLTARPSPYNIGILICLLTGMRIGEVCALCWEDISFTDHTMYVHKTVQRIQFPGSSGPRTGVIVTSPKSVCGKRTIPLPENLETLLRDMDTAKTGFVLSRNGVQVTEPRVLQYHFKKILKEMEIEEVNFHALRHTFATRCVEIGFDVKSLSEILGHSSVSITMNKYVHPSMRLKHENMQRLSSLFAVK